jgi:hypothetical protein
MGVGLSPASSAALFWPPPMSNRQVADLLTASGRLQRFPMFPNPNQVSKIRQVVVAWTSRRPLLLVMRPSAVPIRRPQLITVPAALIRPVAGAIGRTNETLKPRVVEPVLFGKVEWIARPMQLSSIVAARPPWTVPGRYLAVLP